MTKLELELRSGSKPCARPTRPTRSGSDPLIRFYCECSIDGCRERSIRLTIAEYNWAKRDFCTIVLPDHVQSGWGIVETVRDGNGSGSGEERYQRVRRTT